VLVAACHRRERFPVLAELLGDGRLANLCRTGLAVAQLHAWGRRPGGGLLVEVIELTAADYT
jgi:hypothetical protein